MKVLPFYTGYSSFHVIQGIVSFLTLPQDLMNKQFWGLCQKVLGCTCHLGLNQMLRPSHFLFKVSKCSVFMETEAFRLRSYTLKLTHFLVAQALYFIQCPRSHILSICLPSCVPPAQFKPKPVHKQRVTKVTLSMLRRSLWDLFQ